MLLISYWSHDKDQNALKSIGLWCCSILLPYEGDPNDTHQQSGNDISLEWWNRLIRNYSIDVGALCVSYWDSLIAQLIFVQIIIVTYILLWHCLEPSEPPLKTNTKLAKHILHCKHVYTLGCNRVETVVKWNLKQFYACRKNSGIMLLHLLWSEFTCS